MRDRREAGFALVAALWGLVLVGALAGAYLSESRHVVSVSENRNAELRARYAALAGLERAHNALERLHVLSLDAVTRLDAVSQAHLNLVWNDLDRALEEIARDCLRGGCYEFRVRDLGTALNVNLASESQLRRLFLALGVDYREADIAAQSIADWMDADDLHRARGAEREYYLALAFPYGPRNGLITDLSELRRVRGLSGQLYDLAAPHLSVEGDGKINLNAAPEPVLAAVPGLGPEALRVVLDGRRRGVLLSNVFDLAVRLGPDAQARLRNRMSEFMQVSVFVPRQIEVKSTGWSGDRGASAEFRAVYVRSGERVALVKRSRSYP
jgi:type II secretory pathway component PulK